MRKTIPKPTQPTPKETPLVIRVALFSVNAGWKGRMKSSRTTRATAFKQLDKELNKTKRDILFSESGTFSKLP